MPAAVFADVAKQVISLLNAQAVTTAYPTGPTDIGTPKRNADEIKEAVVESDIEARIAICETPGNGFRNGFLTTSVLSPVFDSPHTAKLPERIGPVSLVEIKYGSASDDWAPAEQAPLSEILEMIRNPDGVFAADHNTDYSPTAGYYYIDENSDFITWTGQFVRVIHVSVGVIDRVTPTLAAPEAYFPFVVARSIARLAKHGDVMPFIQHYEQQANQMEMLIRRGRIVLPQLEAINRAA